MLNNKDKYKTNLVELLSPMWEIRVKPDAGYPYTDYKYIIRAKVPSHEYIFYFKQVNELNSDNLGHDKELAAKNCCELICKMDLAEHTLKQILNTIHNGVAKWPNNI